MTEILVPEKFLYLLDRKVILKILFNVFNLNRSTSCVKMQLKILNRFLVSLWKLQLKFES